MDIDERDKVEGMKTLSGTPSLMPLVEALLKRPGELVNLVREGRGSRAISILFGLALACFLMYGAMMGGFSGHPQWLAAAVKVAVGMLLAALLCYPSLFIFACLSGADVRPGQAAALLVGSLALVSVLLLGFVPVAFIFTCSTNAVSFMGFIHLVIWLASFAIGTRFLRQGLKALSASRPGIIAVWCLVFLLTMVQMSTTLRPLVGTSPEFLRKEKKFFLVHWGETVDAEIKANQEEAASGTDPTSGPPWIGRSKKSRQVAKTGRGAKKPDGPVVIRPRASSEPVRGSPDPSAFAEETRRSSHHPQ